MNIGIKAGELRANRYGVLLIVYDLTPRSAYSWGIIEQQSWVFALAILVAVAALYLFARIHILRPAILLQKAMQRIGSGDFSVKENILGQGEFKTWITSLGKWRASLLSKDNKQKKATLD